MEVIAMITQEVRDRIHSLCKEYRIRNYTIRDDGLVDVNGNVDFSRVIDLRSLPIRFGEVTGSFICRYQKMSSLCGSPISVGGSFDFNNNELTSLEGCPEYVGGDFFCNNNRLTSLDGCPITIGGTLECHDNHLTTLAYFPKEVSYVKYWSGNEGLTLLQDMLTEHFPDGYTDVFDPFGIFYDNYNLHSEEIGLVFKYMNYYDVWEPEFNRDNMQLLINDIKDGLR